MCIYIYIYNNVWINNLSWNRGHKLLKNIITYLLKAFNHKARYSMLDAPTHPKSNSLIIFIFVHPFLKYI